LIDFIFSLNKTLKLFVAGYDGVVCVYEVNTIDGGECKQISQYLLFSMSPNQQTGTTNDGNTKVYPANLITNDHASLPLSSTPPPISPTAAKNIVHQTSNITIDEQNFPRLPSPPQGVYD
jgi:hypothetical protein